MHKGQILTAAILCAAVYAIAPAQADVLLIEKIQQTRQAAEVPASGLSMAEVAARFGQPAQKRAPVGDPPITRWIYPTYSVFFEYEYVIDSVVHPQVVGLHDPDA